MFFTIKIKKDELEMRKVKKKELNDVTYSGDDIKSNLYSYHQ